MLYEFSCIYSQLFKCYRKFRNLLHLLEGDDLLLVHGGQDGDQDGVTLLEGGDDLLGDLVVVTVGLLGQVQIVLGITVLQQDGDGTRIRIQIDQLVLSTSDVRDLHVVGSRGHILDLLVSEDIDTGDGGLGVTVLSGLGGGDLDELAREALQHAVTTLTEGTSLHRVGEGGTGIGGLELMILRSHYESFVC